MLFQSVVLPCQYNSVSTQTPVVQWVYKSYCRDRTRDSFSHADVLSSGLGGGGLNGGTGGGYETGMTASYLDCADSSRTVRTVASISGSSVTLSEYYKNRDISINNSKKRHKLHSQQRNLIRKKEGRNNLYPNKDSDKLTL